MSTRQKKKLRALMQSRIRDVVRRAKAAERRKARAPSAARYVRASAPGVQTVTRARMRGERDRPWLTVKYTKPATYVALHVPVSPGRFLTIKTKVDNAYVRRKLAQEGVLIGLSLGGIWNGVKKAAKKVGVDKVISVARKALPIAAAVVPPPYGTIAAAASTAIETGAQLIKMAEGKQEGDPAKQAEGLGQAIRAGRAYERIVGPGLASGRGVSPAALQGGARLYQMVVRPA